MDQIGHVLQRLIHAVATAPEGCKIYFAKWDIKDGFWQMVSEEGAEWNFCYTIIAPDGTKKKENRQAHELTDGLHRLWRILQRCIRSSSGR